jgi:hypothetical protein
MASPAASNALRQIAGAVETREFLEFWRSFAIFWLTEQPGTL